MMSPYFVDQHCFGATDGQPETRRTRICLGEAAFRRKIDVFGTAVNGTDNGRFGPGSRLALQRQQAHNQLQAVEEPMLKFLRHHVVALQ
jgi:hypothetical protein